ncbi:MAG: hypothetical protein NC548_35205 [Lachnospiraceae bacterium]|nr:hypothetical protein [Lachnospiraceae bacterium]
MARQKKNKVFDLFKSSFQITFFYKPTMQEDDVFYYVVLDDSLRLKIILIRGVVIIDNVVQITNTYVKPLFEKMVQTIMNQHELTVLMNVIGNSTQAIQACVSCDAPLVEDERYLTVSQGYYTKLKNVYNNDLTKYGFYILSVSDADVEPAGEESQPQVSNYQMAPVGVEPPVLKVIKRFKTKLKTPFPKLAIEHDEGDSFICTLMERESFTVEVKDEDIYIRDLIQLPTTMVNLIKMMDLITMIEGLTDIAKNVYILSVQNAEINSICMGKKFIKVKEEQNLPVSRLFRQAFHGYGTYKIPVKS